MKIAPMSLLHLAFHAFLPLASDAAPDPHESMAIGPTWALGSCVLLCKFLKLACNRSTYFREQPQNFSISFWKNQKSTLFKRSKYALLNIWSFWRTGPTATPLGGAGALPAPFRAPQGKIFFKNGIFCNFPVARCARWPPLHRPAFGQGAVLFFVRVHRV